MMIRFSVSAVALGVSLAAGSAFAYQQGDFIVRVGAAAVDPRENSSELALNDTPLTDVVAVAAPATAGVDSNTQLGLTFTYMVSDNIGFALLGATPFQHTVTANLGAVGVVKAAEVTHLSPTFSAQYYFLGKDSRFQPYAGIGINYTTFFDEDVDAELDAVTTTLGLGEATGVKLDDSFGFAFEVGCDFAVTDRIIVNAAVWKIDIDTTATFSYAGGNKIKADVGIDPMVYMVAAGYKF